MDIYDVLDWNDVYYLRNNEEYIDNDNNGATS